jgi:hypothetical protein
VRGFPQERGRCGDAPSIRSSFKTKGHRWCREGDFLEAISRRQWYQQDAVFCVT